MGGFIIYIKNSVKKIIPQVALLCICFVAILVCANGVSATTPGQVIICFDDGNAAAYSSAFTYMESHGDINGTAYVNGATIGDGDNTMTVAQLQEMNAAGWIIGNHGYNHVSFDGMSNENITNEIQDNINFLTSNGLGNGAYDLAYPGGDYGTTQADVNNLFGIMDDLGVQTGRDIDSAPLNLATDNYQIPGYIIANDDTVATVESYINQVQTGSDVVLIFHDLVPTTADQNPDYYQYASTNFDQIIDYINNQGISTATIDQLYKEKQALLTQTTIKVTALTGFENEVENLVGTLTDNNGKPISGQTIHFSIDGIFIGDGVTDSSGIATYQYALTQGLGAHNLTANFVTGNNNIYAASHNTDINNLQITLPATKIILNGVTGITGKIVNLIAKITDNNGNPLSGKTIQFLIDGKAIGSNVTDSTGTAVLSHKVTETQGSHVITAKFVGDNTYASSQNTSKLTVPDTTPPTAWSNLKSGLYNTNKVIILSMSEPGTIYYNLNGGTPTTKYTKSFTITQTSKLSYKAVDSANNTSPIYTNTYTIDKIPPKVLSISPKNKQTSISTTSSIVIKFTETVSASTNWNNIYVKNLKTGKQLSISKQLSKNTLTIKTAKRSTYTKYQVYIPSGAVKDTAGNKMTTTSSTSFETA